MFELVDTRRENTKTFDTRAEAEEKKNDMVSLGAKPEDLEITKVSSDGGDGLEPGTKVSGTAEVVDTEEEPEPVEEPNYDLPDEKPSVDTDPLAWIPEAFQDTIDGTVAINRKGFEVLAHHYNISCETDLVDHSEDRVIHKAKATTEAGIVYTAYGEAHSSEDKDTQLIRLSDTRAFKRAVSRATGIGMVAVEELQGEL